MQVTLHENGSNLCFLVKMERSGPHALNEQSTILLQSDVATWDHERVLKWMEQENLQPYIPLFQELYVSGPNLLDFNDVNILNNTFTNLNDDEKRKLSLKINNLINEKGNLNYCIPNFLVLHNARGDIPNLKYSYSQNEKIDHLLFVVHGVGSHEERWKEIVPKLMKNRDEMTPLTSNKDFKTEIVVVEWHKALHSHTDK
jgi:hypothetical protein